MIRPLILTFALLAAAPAAQAQKETPRETPAEKPQDRHAGYYFPKEFTVEKYVARAQTLIGASKKQRLLFVNNLTSSMLKRDRLPPFAIFAKGAQSEKLIIVGMGDWIGSLYQARALLAMLTAQARQTEAFRKHKVEDVFTFFDFAVMLGFTRLTITDGKTFAHQIRFVHAR